MGGIILVNEMLHSNKTKKILRMMVKLDIAKSYDKINCQSTRSMLTIFGFQVEWVDWIMNLVSQSLLSILVNGVLSGHIKPSMGII